MTRSFETELAGDDSLWDTSYSAGDSSSQALIDKDFDDLLEDDFVFDLIDLLDTEVPLK